MPKNVNINKSAFDPLNILVLPGINIYQMPSNEDYQIAASLLSTLVKAEAATLAIAISLSLLAIQLASTSYSPRVITIIKKDFYFFLVIILYIFSIILGLSGLRYSEFLKNEDYISACFLLGIICFLALIPYVWHILGMLQPSKIIFNLSQDINGEIFDVISPGSQSDAVQPITDIVIRSMAKIEQSTIINGLNSLSDRLKYLLDNIILSDDQQTNFSNLISYHFTFIGVNAIKMENPYATELVIKKMKLFGLEAIDKDYQDVAKEIASSIMQVGNEASESDISSIAYRAAETIGEIGSAAARKGQCEVTCQAAESLGELGKTVAGKKMRGAAYQAVNSLREIGLKVVQKEDMFIATEVVISSLGSIGEEAAKDGLEGAASQAVFSLESIGISANKEGYDELSNNIIDRVILIEKTSRENKLENLEKKCMDCINKLSINAA
jgi:hypothetical protein